jgi:hypothetical protein
MSLAPHVIQTITIQRCQNMAERLMIQGSEKMDSPWTEVEVVIPLPQFSLINSFCVVSSIIFNSPFEFKQQRP